MLEIFSNAAEQDQTLNLNYYSGTVKLRLTTT